MEGRIIGLGGVFVKVADPEATRAWYARVFGIAISPWGAGEFVGPEAGARTVWSPMAMESDYFAPSGREVMLNFVADDLDALLARARAQGVAPVGDVLEESCGRFAWFLDPDGFKIEVWQPLAPPA